MSLSFDHHVNCHLTVWTLHRPYYNALTAAGYTAFPQYCVNDYGYTHLYAFALHRGDTLTAFVQLCHRGRSMPLTCGGLPIVYATSIAGLLTQLQGRSILP